MCNLESHPKHLLKKINFSRLLSTFLVRTRKYGGQLELWRNGNLGRLGEAALVCQQGYIVCSIRSGSKQTATLAIHETRNIKGGHNWCSEFRAEKGVHLGSAFGGHKNRKMSRQLIKGSPAGKLLDSSLQSLFTTRNMKISSHMFASRLGLRDNGAPNLAPLTFPSPNLRREVL